MVNNLDEKQQAMEDRYTFPVHYLVRFRDGVFMQSKYIRWGFRYAIILENIVDILKSQNFETLLDIGCGDGKFVYEANSLLPNKKIAGLDYSDKAVAIAKALNPDYEFFCGDITDPSFASEKQDIVTLIETLEHIPLAELPDFTEALASRIKPGGKLILSVPTDNIPTQPFHVQHFNHKTLESTLEKNFTIEKIIYINPDGWLDWLTMTILSNRLFLLNQHRLRNWLYQNYKQKSKKATRSNARGLIAICTPK